ncbi:hypothetical protein [Mycobacterium sp.]|uniref:hypothetical protein n=1 Tax=Mycobacterium sp. TaxID=1785 RepID=UPI0025DEA1C7|nr:hypothetical protein [Mycobacterium sp.]
MVRVGVDPSGALTPAELDKGMTTLLQLARAAGADLVPSDLAAMPADRREVQLLIAGDDPDTVKGTAVRLCTRAFGTVPVTGAITYVSRGTDEDAHGVLAGFGLTGEIERVPGDQGYDIVYVTLRREDIERIPESRVHTALEASLNCEVHIRTR